MGHSTNPLGVMKISHPLTCHVKLHTLLKTKYATGTEKII